MFDNFTKNDVNAVFIDEGTIVTKLLYNPVAHDLKYFIF